MWLCQWESLSLFLSWQLKLIDPLHQWHLNLKNNTLYIRSLYSCFQTKGFHMNARLMMYNWALLFMVRLPVMTSTCWQTCSHLYITNILTSLDNKWHHECIVVFKFSLTLRLRGHKQGIEWACLFMFIACVIWASRTKTAGKCWKILSASLTISRFLIAYNSAKFSICKRLTLFWKRFADKNPDSMTVC